METNEIIESPLSLDFIPVLPLRDMVVYPHMVIPLFVGREGSVQALDAAMKEDKQILLVAQKEAEVDVPALADLYQVGTLANILQLLKLPDGTVKVLIEGNQRCLVREYQEIEGYFSATILEITDNLEIDDKELEVLMRTAVNAFDEYVKLDSNRVVFNNTS